MKLACGKFSDAKLNVLTHPLVSVVVLLAPICISPTARKLKFFGLPVVMVRVSDEAPSAPSST